MIKPFISRNKNSKTVAERSSVQLVQARLFTTRVKWRTSKPFLSKYTRIRIIFLKTNVRPYQLLHVYIPAIQIKLAT